MQNKSIFTSKKWVILLFLTLQIGHAQSFWDMLYNQSYDFNNYVKKHDSDKNYLFGTIEITQYSFTEKEKEIYPNLNKKVFETCVNSLEDELKYRVILQNALDKLDVLSEIVNSQYSRNYENNASQYNPKLDRIEISVLSIVGTKACYEFQYIFSINSQDDKEIDVKDYYWGDLRTSSLVKMDKKPSEYQRSVIQKLISKTVNENYLLATQKLNIKEVKDLYGIDEDEDENSAEIQEKLEKITDIFDKIDLKDADFLWFHHGLLIQFQKYSPSSRKMGGNRFSFFIPYQEALACLPLIPELSFISQVPLVKTSVRNWIDYDFMRAKFYYLRSEPTILDLFRKSPKYKPIKQINQTISQVYSNGEKRFSGRNVFQFDNAQKLLMKESFDDNGNTYSKTFYDYNEQGNLAFTTVKSRHEKTETTQNTYDRNNNLKLIRTNNPEEVSDVHFFYNQEKVFYFTHQMFDELSKNVAHISLEADKFCTDNVCYLLNRNGEINGIQSQKYTHYQAQIGRNEQGILQEAHFDNDRYHYYFDYNQNQFLTSFKMYEYSQKKLETTWFYEPNAYLPYKILRLQSYNENILQEEIITWEHF
uniref:hypothetical protein n=3 Tax=Flavobacterium sp. TaxID=239 RepID=UPI00404A0F41